MIDRYAALNSALTFEQFWQHLEECGWLALLTDDQRDTMHGKLKRALEQDKTTAYLALATFRDDGESIYNVGPDNLSYWAWITEWAELSRGLFQPTDVHDEYVRDKNGEPIAFRVSFRLGDRFYQHETDDLSDWFDMRVLELVNRAIRETGGKVLFEPLPFRDQTIDLILVSDSIYRCAVRRGLLPPPAYWYPQDHHLRLPLCEWFYELVETTPPDQSVLEEYRRQVDQWMRDNWNRFPQDT